MTIEQRVAVLEEIFAKLRDYYILLYSGEEIDALLASAGVPIGITKEYDSVSAMNDDFSSTDVARGQFVLILPTDTSSENYGKVYLKGSANWVYVFTLTSLTAIKGPQGPAGKRGAKGADGADGKNFMVLGYYETLSALNAAVPSPGPGDTYGVGTEPPYAFYMYDQTISNWRYVGNLQGPAGPTGGEDNFVRYDAAQSLTNEQKAQARTNIGADTVQGTVRYDTAQTLTDAQKQQARGNIAAAPDGFGLGKGTAHEVVPDCNDVKLSGLYIMSSNTTNYPTLIPNGQYSLLRVSARTVDAILQEVFCVGIDGQSDFSAVRSYGSTGVWSPWEYVNPPMNLGVEYRTTERYLGKPVYVKMINCGKLPNAGLKTVNIGVSGLEKVIDISGCVVDASNGDFYSIPATNFDASVHNVGLYATGPQSIAISTQSDRSSYSAYVKVKYTKTTD